MWHKAIWKRHPMRLELTRVVLLAELANHYTTRGASLNLWNGMFDRHQAEITVMQFTGHSLPVYLSMSIPWDFYLVPFFQPRPPTRFLLKTTIGMSHFLPVHHFGMACLAGSKINIQHKPLSKKCPIYDHKQYLMKFGEYGVPSYWHYSQVYSDPEW